LAEFLELSLTWFYQISLRHQFHSYSYFIGAGRNYVKYVNYLTNQNSCYIGGRMNYFNYVNYVANRNRLLMSCDLWLSVSLCCWVYMQLLTGTRRGDYIYSPVLRQLHCLPVPRREHEL